MLFQLTAITYSDKGYDYTISDLDQSFYPNHKVIARDEDGDGKIDCYLKILERDENGNKIDPWLESSSPVLELTENDKGRIQSLVGKNYYSLLTTEIQRAKEQLASAGEYSSAIPGKQTHVVSFGRPDYPNDSIVAHAWDEDGNGYADQAFFYWQGIEVHLIASDPQSGVRVYLDVFDSLFAMNRPS